MSTSIYTDHFCNLCNSRATYLSNKNRYWCSRNPSSCPGVKEIRKQKSLEKYGTDNPSKSKVIKDKISAINAGLADQAKIQRKNTCLEKYSVETVMEVEQFRNNCSVSHLARTNEQISSANLLRENSCSEKYGKSHIGKVTEIRSKIKETHIERYGKHFNNRPAAEITCLEKYGVANPAQDSLIIAKIRKNQYKSKLYTFPSGKEVCVQGYEPRAIDQLLLHYTEDEIVVETAQIPRIEYLGIDKKTHYYFPDIFIPKENLIIEVKSIWTYEQDKKTVLLKEQACIAAGFNYKFIIY